VPGQSTSHEGKFRAEPSETPQPTAAGSLRHSGSILSARPDGSLRVFQRATHGLRFFKAVWSPNGRRMLSGCFDTQPGIDRICTISHVGRISVVVSGPQRLISPRGGQTIERHLPQRSPLSRWSRRRQSPNGEGQTGLMRPAFSSNSALLHHCASSDRMPAARTGSLQSRPNGDRAVNRRICPHPGLANPGATGLCPKEPEPTPERLPAMPGGHVPDEAGPGNLPNETDAGRRLPLRRKGL
jgi:hypothetical protein